MHPLPRPEPPDPTECCGNGCANCVWDLYATALDRWRGAQRDLITDEPPAASPAAGGNAGQ